MGSDGSGNAVVAAGERGELGKGGKSNTLMDGLVPVFPGKWPSTTLNWPKVPLGFGANLLWPQGADQGRGGPNWSTLAWIQGFGLRWRQSY